MKITVLHIPLSIASAVFILFLFFQGCRRNYPKEKIAALMKLGAVADSMGHNQEAINIYTDVLKIDSIKYTALILRGRALILSGKLKQGFDDYSKMVRWYPSARSYLTRAMAWEELRKDKEAMADLRRCLQYNPNYGQAYYGLSAVKLNQNDIDSASYYCRIADGMSYSQLFSTTTWYAIYEKRRDYQSAVDIATKAIANDPHNYFYYNNRGYSLMHLHQYKKALEDLNVALSLAPFSYYSLNNKAEALLHMNMADSALIYVNHSLAIFDKNAYAFKNRGEIYLALKDKTAACKDLAQALMLSRDSLLTAQILDLKRPACY